jgi:hypothetical protein
MRQLVPHFSEKMTQRSGPAQELLDALRERLRQLGMPEDELMS